MPVLQLDRVIQDFRRPVVYLDHWAVMRLSEPVHSARFAAALVRAKGTLLLTMGMLTEFHSVTSDTGNEAVEALLNRLMPNIFISNPSLMGEGEGECPMTDVHVLSHIALAPKPMDVEGLILAAPRAEAKDKAAFTDFCVSVAATMNAERSAPDFMHRARSWRPDPAQPLSSNLLKGLKRQALLDPRAVFEPNDSSDLIHSLHATRYADHALLDGKWVERVRQMRDYFKRHGFGPSLPATYSERKAGVEDFLARLEAADPADSRLVEAVALDLSEARRAQKQSDTEQLQP